MSVLQDPTLNSLLTIAGVLFGIISVVLAVVFYRRSVRAREPRYIMESWRVISESESRIRHFTMRIGDNELKHVSLTKILFWNAGRETILRSDVSQNAPLRLGIRAPARIYDVSIPFTSKPECDFRVSNQSFAEAKIDFEFVGHGDGCVIQVIHDARSPAELHLSAGFKGFDLKRVRPRPVWQQAKRPLTADAGFATLGALISIMVFATAGVLGALDGFGNWGRSVFWSSLGAMVGSMLLIIRAIRVRLETHAARARRRVRSMTDAA
jgi:hypothetical protein